MKKRRFTQEEDALIKKLVEEKKYSSWEEVARHVPGRTGCQCRDRYNSYLFNEAKNTKRWTEEEDRLLVQKYKELGPHWVKISEFFNGRTGNQIKNRWHKSLVQYHGISHNSVKQERRSKKVKFQQSKSPEPQENANSAVFEQKTIQIPDQDFFQTKISESFFTDFFGDSLESFFTPVSVDNH